MDVNGDQSDACMRTSPSSSNAQLADGGHSGNVSMKSFNFSEHVTSNDTSSTAIRMKRNKVVGFVMFLVDFGKKKDIWDFFEIFGLFWSFFNG